MNKPPPTSSGDGGEYPPWRDSVSDDDAVLDAVASLTADITGPDVARLRAFAARALKLREGGERLPATSIARLLPLEHPDDVRDAVRSDILATELPDDAVVLEVHRRDTRELLLEGRLVDHLSALAPSERLGPFVADGGAHIWFDLFFGARQLVVTVAGETVPSLVLTGAGNPVVGGGSSEIPLRPGTVWIRGDLVDDSLPSGAFVGVKVSGGQLNVKGAASIAGDNVELAAPLTGELRLELAADEVAPAAGGCTSSGAKIELPESLSLTFGPGGSDAGASSGTAHVWGQDFEFDASAGSWVFVAALWTVVLEYDVAPQKLDTDPMPTDLVDFDGTASIVRAGLGLPVVLSTNPAMLGAVAQAPGWWLSVTDLQARWYEPDPRVHPIDAAWVGVSPAETVVYAEGIAGLSPPVSHAFALWSIARGNGQRLPWRQTYEQPFRIHYRCNVVSGEYLLVTGESTVSLDRPVQINGIPVVTPTTQGALLLHRLDTEITATLAALVARSDAVQQLALRNALVWTTRPVALFARGRLVAPQRIDEGDALLLLGVYAWAPTLPDPYVANARLRQPDFQRGRAARTLLVAHVSWAPPDDVTVSFEGQLGPPSALAGREASAGDPVPAPKDDDNVDIGPTQVGQHMLTHDNQEDERWKRARQIAMERVGERLGIAEEENARTRQLIDGYMSEVLGRAPNLLLLDVSTNQDLLGVALGGRGSTEVQQGTSVPPPSPGGFPVSRLAVNSRVADMRVVTLPQVQWEPVRTLDPDQDIITLGWFPTPLASATDGGATQLGARSQRLMPSIPEDALQGTYDAYSDGTPVAFRTTLPFGLVAAVQLQPHAVASRQPDLYELTRPKFPDQDAVGGLHVTAIAERGRPDLGGVSPMFGGRLRQLLNGVDLPTGAPLGLSVLGSTADPVGSVETVFNNDMASRPRVPVKRFDLSGYGGSNFSEWNNPFAAFAEAAKVQFRLVIGRTALEVIKVNSVLHPWGIRVTRSVTIERRPGGGVIRRDSGWQAFTPGLFDYRYFDTSTNAIVVAPYTFDAGVFKGLFNARSIRPAPGSPFSNSGATMVPYYFDAELALDGLAGRTPAIGVLGYLQTEPNGVPSPAAALQNLLQTQGPVGGPLDAWVDFGGSGLPFRAGQIEVGLALDGANPVFVATVRGVPKLPRTGAWSVVARPVASVPPGGGEAVAVPESRGVPLIRRYPVRYQPNDAVFDAPPLDGPPSVAGDYRFADAADLLTPTAPKRDYALLHSTPTHAFLFPRPYVPSSSPPRIQTTARAALADVIARSTSKGAFPPPPNTIQLAPGGLHFNVGTGGTLALSSVVNVVGHPTPLRLAGTTGHGSVLDYDVSTLTLEIQADRWSAEFAGLQIWTDIIGLERLTGSDLRIVGSTEQRPQITELRSLILAEIEEILQYIPLMGDRGVQGPIDLGASNAVHELKLEFKVKQTIPPVAAVPVAGSGLELELTVNGSTGFDLTTGGLAASATFGASLEGKVPLLSVGVASVFLIVVVEAEFTIKSVSGAVTSEELELLAFVGIGVEGRIGPFNAYAFLGIGFVLTYDVVSNVTKYGGLVALEAGVDLGIVEVSIRAELKGLVYDDAGTTKCDYSGSVEIEVEIFLIFSISASYEITETAVC